MILKQVQVEKMCIKLRLCLRAEKPKLPNFFQAQSARSAQSARQKLIKVQWRKIPDISNDLNSFQGGCHELHDLKQKLPFEMETLNPRLQWKTRAQIVQKNFTFKKKCIGIFFRQGSFPKGRKQ